MYKKIHRLTALFLCISLLTISVFGASDYNTYSISNIKFKSLETNYHSLSGEYYVVDPAEFLSYVTVAYGKNSDYRTYFDGAPYSVQNVEFNNPNSTEEFLVLCFAYGFYDLRSSWRNQGEIVFDGHTFDTDNHSMIQLYSGDCFFDHYKTVNGVNGTNFSVACNSNNIVIACELGVDATMFKVVNDLDSIVTACSSINSVMPNIDLRLSSILNAVTNARSDISYIRTYTSNIKDLVTSIDSTVSSILSDTQDINLATASMEDYISTYYPVFDAELSDIYYKLNSFKSAFDSYAQSVIGYLNSIDSTTTHIDDTLSDIFDQMNGTALEGITVQGSSSPNLWQLIKSSVGTGLSGLGSLFELLFQSITNFASNALSGFALFGSSSDSLSNYSPINYQPTDLVNPPEPPPIETNLAKPFAVKNVSTGSPSYCSISTQYNGDVVSGYRVYCQGGGTSPLLYADIRSGMVLEPGTYRIYRFCPSNYVYYTVLSGNTVIKKSPDSGSISYSTFTINSTTTCSIKLYCNKAYSYDYIGYPNIEKVS